MITFDDGWGEDMWIARQYLDPRAMPTVFFVYTGAVGAPGFLSWSDVKALEAGGHEVLSHTVSHPNLQQVPDARLASEMRDSRARLEQELGHPVECMAYPFGLRDGRVVQAAADAGYRLAVIADGPGATDASPALELPRWKMAYGEPLPLFVQRLRAP
jgi:peptidoglycan/xylan/chitin deacetylase (PgdA/CDA1 family)